MAVGVVEIGRDKGWRDGSKEIGRRQGDDGGEATSIGCRDTIGQDEVCNQSHVTQEMVMVLAKIVIR
eukprot:scaffold3939_cov166-Amphora_coffeaeformis.AAC.11